MELGKYELREIIILHSHDEGRIKIILRGLREV